MNETKICPECGNPVPADSQHQLCPACLMAQAFASRTMDGENPPSAAPPEPEEIAGKFPQFEILECLGRGGMGVVYKARQKSLNRIVAIKILAPEREQDARFAERFAREAELLARLSHPHIVIIHDFGETGGLYFLVMEYVDGVNLRDLLRDGKLEPKQALAIVPPICEALQYAHDKGIVHRDIKPENLLLDREGRIKIADFGIASLIGASDEKTGTPPYMAPEQAGGSVDRRADIYALGVVLYEMLTGERPGKDFIASSKRVQIDVRIDEMVLRALEKDPEKRYQTAEDFRTVVDTVVAIPVSVPAFQSPPTETSPASRFSRKAIVGACLVPVFLVASYLSFILISQFVASGMRFGEYTAALQTWSNFAILLFAVLGLASPVVTAVLGWSAVSQIRRSAGKIHGMRLAVFDGLFCPLLLLNWLTAYLIYSFGIKFHFWTRNDTIETDVNLILMIVVLSLIADFFIFRAVWQALKPSPESSRFGHTRLRRNPKVTLAYGLAVFFAFAAFLYLGSGLLIHELSAINVRMRSTEMAKNLARQETATLDHEANAKGADEYEPPELLPGSTLLATVRIVDIPENSDRSVLMDAAARMDDKRLRVLAVLRTVVHQDKEGEIFVPWIPGHEFNWDDLTPRKGRIFVRAKLRDSTVVFDAASQQDPIAGTKDAPPERKSMGNERPVQLLQQAVLEERLLPFGRKQLTVISFEGAPPGSKPGPMQPATGGYSYGPVIERVVNDPEKSTQDCLIDLDTGKLADLPFDAGVEGKIKANFRDVLTGIRTSPATKGMDATAQVTEGGDFDPKPGLVGAYMNANSYTWKSRDASSTIDFFNTADFSPDRQGKFVPMPYGSLDLLHDVAWAFCTDDGNRGLLQVTDFTDDKNGVKIRYKLVEKPSIGWDPLPGSKFIPPDFSEEAILSGGLSPGSGSGGYEVRVHGRPYDMPFGYDIRIYAAGQSEPIHILDDVGGYMRYSTAKEMDKALWSVDAKYVVISDRGTKRTNAIQILALEGNQVQRLELPDYMHQAMGLVGATETDRFHWTNLEKWEGDDLHLKLEFHTVKGTFTCDVVLHLEHPEGSTPVVSLKSCSTPTHRIDEQ